MGELVKQHEIRAVVLESVAQSQQVLSRAAEVVCPEFFSITFSVYPAGSVLFFARRDCLPDLGPLSSWPGRDLAVPPSCLHNKTLARAARAVPG